MQSAEELALRNIQALVRKMLQRVYKGGAYAALETDLEHILRFCAEAGVEASVLRDDKELG